MSLRSTFVFLILLTAVTSLATHSPAWAAGSGSNRVFASTEGPDLQPENPESAYTQDRGRMMSAFASPDDPGLNHLPTIDFCSEWNPEFSFNGHRCCRSLASVHAKKGRISCFSRHKNGGFCDEVTAEEKQYIADVQNGLRGDILELLNHEAGHQEQAFCTANNGFLAHGRPIVPSDKNHVVIRDTSRCTQFGTDQMIGMVEWLGRQVGTKYAGTEYSKTHLLVGDISAPRGGCLSGKSGVIGHLSHTNGSDADIGLLTPRKNGPSPAAFSNELDAKANWWMIKQILKNPYACVKVIFLDKRHINKLAKFAWPRKGEKDPEWTQYHRFLRHQKGHRNHMHVRVGDHPGLPGCSPGSNPELEEDAIDTDSDEADAVDSVGSSMSHPLGG